MIHHFLDSSAFAKLFIDEAGRASLVQHLETVVSSDAVSVLAQLEVQSAFYRRLRFSEMSVDEISQGLTELQETLNASYALPLTAAVLQVAGDLLARHVLRSLDAIQLATAILWRAELDEGHRLLFIACDRRLLAAAALEGFTVWNPEDQSTAPLPDTFPVN